MIRIGLVADDLTRECLESSFDVVNLTPFNYRFTLRLWRPDFILVESAWNGRSGAWKYKIASYPGDSRRNNLALRNLVHFARDKGIPIVFWNKEDSVHFDRFIESASLFDLIFTVDINSIKRYRALIPPTTKVFPLMFGIQPLIHNFTGFNFVHKRANFVGSYSNHIHDERRKWQTMFFSAAANSGFGLTIIDRNSVRRSVVYRYPDFPGAEVLPAIGHSQTASVYKNFVGSLNVNTIQDSETMVSRRFLEILACGGIAITNPALSIETHFKDFCHVIRSTEEALDLFSRLKYGPSNQDLEMAHAGSLYVLKNHTWNHRIEQVYKIVQQA